MITFNRFKGSKGLFEEYKKEGLLDLNDEAIVFIYDDKDRYIYDYSTNTYFGSTEIYVGSESPALDGSIKLWIDTNDSSIKYNPNNESWITISSGEGNLIYIGENPPADDSDYVVWINPDEIIEEEEENPLVIDSALNASSLNPVSNKAITEEFNKIKNNKQDKLSEENLKTIDNESLLGKGNIDLESKYLKKTDAEAFITEGEVAEQYQPKGDYLTAEDLSELADVASSGSFNDLADVPDFTLTYVGEGEPEINSDFNRWINPNEESFDGVDVYNALIEYVNTKFKAIDDVLELIIGEEI